MQEIFYSLALILVLSAGIALLFRIHQRRAPEGDTQATLDYATMWVGVIYAIMLGLSVAAVWEARQGAEDAVRAEAVAVARVQAAAEQLPGPERARAEDAARAYARSVLDDEWPKMRDSGAMSEVTETRLTELRQVIMSFEPENQRQISAFRSGFDGVEKIAAQRVERAAYADEGAGLSAYIWFGLIAGAGITLGFVFVYPTNRSWTHVIVVVGMCVMIGFLLHFLWDLNTPFSNAMRVTPDTFEGPLLQR